MVEKFDPDIIHSHNAPDFLTIAAIEAVGGSVPVVHDCHEILSLFKTGYYAGDDERKISEAYPKQEKIANERSNGRIYVSEGVRDYIQRRYSVDPERDLVFYSHVSESMVPRLFKEKLSRRDKEVHVVYIGCVTSVKALGGSTYDLRTSSERSPVITCTSTSIQLSISSQVATTPIESWLKPVVSSTTTTT